MYSYFLLTLVSALPQLGQEGKVPLKSARLLFDLSEKVKKVVETSFRLEKPLYFTYSHLVCRSAIDGESEPELFTAFQHPRAETQRKHYTWSLCGDVP